MNVVSSEITKQHEPQDLAGQRTMQSIVQERYGTDPKAVLTLRDIARPVVGDEQVLVRVHAASVDMGTWHLTTGMPYLMRMMGFGFGAPKAKNPGRAIAGVVESVPPGVTEFKPGDQVYGSCDAAFAEYTAVDAKRLALKPASLSFDEAAAFPISGGTALQAIQRGKLRPGQNVLVLGASGGVGTFAVQIAKAYGARVTGVCRTSKMDLVRAIGADEVIDYTQGNFATPGPRYDLIIDTGGSRPLTELRRMLTRKGTHVLVGSESGGNTFGDFLGRALKAMVLSMLFPQSLVMLASRESTEVLNELRDLVDAHGLRPAIGRAYSLRDTAAAIEDIKAGRARGKLIVTIDSAAARSTTEAHRLIAGT